MDIKLDKSSTTEALIKITLKEPDYQPKVEEKVKDYSKKAKIDGFRPGKVPPGMIKKLYGKSIKVEEINQIISKSLRDYIKENDLKIIGEPLLNIEKTKDIDWDTQTEFEFEYDIGIVNDFKVNLIQKIRLYQIEMDDKGLKETIENLKTQYGNPINPEISELGDNLNGELSQQESDYKEDTWIFTDLIVKKEVKKFIGLKIGDTIHFDPKKILKNEAETANLLKKDKEELEDINGEFQFTVKKITRIEPGELNQEFFDKVFGKDVVKTKEEFRAKLKETLETNYKIDVQPYNDKLLRDKLVETTNIDLPENFYKKWLINSHQSDINEEDIEKDFTQYIEDLKWNLITQNIEQSYDIIVEKEDVVSAAKNMIRSQFASYGMSETLENQLDAYTHNYLTNNNGENYYRIYSTVRIQKILDVIKDHMDISYKKVKPDEFTKIISS